MDRINVPLITTGAYGTAALCLGVFSVMSPFRMADVFGIASADTPSSASSAEKAPSTGNSIAQNCISAFARAKGVRDLSTGLAYFGLYWVGNSRALGVLAVAHALTGLSDGGIVYRQGDRSKAWKHWAGSSVLAALGVYLIWDGDGGDEFEALVGGKQVLRV